MTPLRVCIDARLISGRAGGVEQVVIGLASGLSGLNDGDEEYLFLTYADADDWIRPYLSGPCRTLPGPRAAGGPKALSLIRKATMLLSDSAIRGSGIDVMHFTHQFGFRTRVPSLYHPHDIQHLHLPQFFSTGKRLVREAVYRYFCGRADVVPVVSSWMRNEIIRHYGLPGNKVTVVPFAPPLAAYPVPNDEDVSETRARFSLPNEFIFYPAQTWPHKNHIRLLEALAALRDRHGVIVPLVSSGRLYEGFFPRIEKRINELRLAEQVRFLGFVSPLELQCLYKACRAVAIPTLYEAASFPMWEAFSAGVPVACSNVTSLPEIAGNAALIFDPNTSDSIADALMRLWTSETLRNDLAERGRANVARLSWDRTARIFRAHYRRIANRPLTDEDRDLLDAPIIHESIPVQERV